MNLLVLGSESEPCEAGFVVAIDANLEFVLAVEDAAGFCADGCTSLQKTWEAGW